jgi:hypothetical protein
MQGEFGTKTTMGLWPLYTDRFSPTVSLEHDTNHGRDGIGGDGGKVRHSARVITDDETRDDTLPPPSHRDETRVDTLAPLSHVSLPGPTIASTPDDGLDLRASACTWSQDCCAGVACGARFWTEFCTRGCNWFPRMFA